MTIQPARYRSATGDAGRTWETEWSWGESVFDLMTRVSGSDGGSNPTEKRQVTGSTPVPTTLDDQPPGWSSPVFGHHTEPRRGPRDARCDRECPGLVARSSRGLDLLVRRLVRPVQPGPAEAFAQVGRPGRSAAVRAGATSWVRNGGTAPSERPSCAATHQNEQYALPWPEQIWCSVRGGCAHG